MSFTKSFHAFPRPVRYAIIGISIAVVTLPLFDLLVLGGDGGHDPAPYSPSHTRVLDICPSIATEPSDPKFRRLSVAALDFASQTNCPVPSIALGGCLGSPAPGHLQIRACSDLLSTDEYGAVGCPEGYVDTVMHSDAGDGAGVAYWSDHDSPHTPHHIIGHGIGLGHTTAASSWMYHIAGSEPTFIACD